MNKNKKLILMVNIILAIIITTIFFVRKEDNKNFISYIADLKKEDVKLYYKDEYDQTFKSLQQLNYWAKKKNKKLLFAMNAGMYNSNNIPKGLFIENKKIVNRLDTASGEGNFYMKPNGIFYITDANAGLVCTTQQFMQDTSIVFATQSGPMLVIDSNINAKFKEYSLNKNIRNGVGILRSGKLLFAMSTKEVNLYNFALFFKKEGCKNALYLDGLVSRAYYPEKKWLQYDGNFGVIIGITSRR